MSLLDLDQHNLNNTMSNPYYPQNLAGAALGGIGAVFEDQDAFGKKTDSGKRDGSLASSLKPKSAVSEIDVVRNYPWTLSNITNPSMLAEIPYLRLIEYKRTEGSLKTQIGFYSNMIPGVAKNAFGVNQQNKEFSVLEPYKEMWPKDSPTGWIYKFPYFNETSFELASQWEDIGDAGEKIKELASGTMGVLFGQKTAEITQKVLNGTQTALGASQAYSYPSVGAYDRPKIFASHSDRNINLSFTLYNTKRADDWQNNRDLAYLLMSQNSFNKRDLTTGAPPVFYEVYIPGQYFCYAAYMSNIKVKNLGNQRLLYNEYIVPDAYQFDLTLTELIKPSKNQLETIASGMATSRVQTSVETGTSIINTFFDQ